MPPYEAAHSRVETPVTAMPRSAACHLGAGALRDCARIDFRRGIPADDWLNVAWASLSGRLPQYRARLRQRQNPMSLKGLGNAMETVVGTAYACYTHGRYLREGDFLS